MVVSGAIAAAFALPGCAPAGYNPADYGAAQPAANAVEAEPSASAGVEEEDQAAEEEKAAPEIPAAKLTTSLTAKTVKRMGEVVVDNKGWVLYRFDKDTAKPPKSNCEGDCEKIWPAALTTEDKPELDGVDAADVGTVERADGTKQITIGDWPVYRYIGDKEPGQWLGQNVGGDWFVVKPDGTKNLTCMPKISKPVAPPADDEAADSAESEESSDSGTDYNY